MQKIAGSFLSVITLALLGLIMSESANAQEVSYSSCQGGDSGLAGQNGIIYCEPFESQDFWRGKGYLKNGSRTKYPVDSGDFSKVTLESNDCVSGSCIKIQVPQNECCGLAIVWPLDEAGLEPETLYFRYYMKLARNFSPELCRNGQEDSDGGKFPGLGDLRAYPEEQCGNGGNPSDGKNCWSARSLFKSCTWACESTPDASTRYGTYAYHPYQDSFWGDHAVWDADVNRQSGPVCSTAHSQNENCPSNNIIPCSSDPSVVGTCGKENFGDLINDRWYAIELQVKMNTVGQENGILRGWVDGNLAYDKTNMVWRLAGHDNLHVRVVWLNIHFGGEFVGPCMEGGTHVLMDQMVVSSQPIGVIGNFSPRKAPNPPENLSTN